MDSDSTPSMPQERIANWKYELERIDKQHETELSLLGSRMMWLSISQSFLFGTFVSSGGLVPAWFGLSVEGLVSLIGLSIAVWVKLAVDAALDVIDALKEQRRPVLERLEIALDVKLFSVSSSDAAHIRGNMPLRFIPLMLILAWCGLILLLAGKIAWLVAAH